MRKEIQELKNEIFRLRDQIGSCNKVIYTLECEAKKYREELQKEKEKYASLLERYIATMERTVGIDERN